ncbi:MAG: bestrophin-like domain, partial [Ferrovibrionaceae bacterium]
AIADQEISIVVWITLVLSATIVGTAVAMVHVENKRTEALTLTLLSILIGSAFWVLLSHDQPFVGTLSVSPKPLIAAVNAL